jgi:hypothetical protein
LAAPAALLEELLLGTPALVDLTIRDAWVRERLQQAPAPVAAFTLDQLCQQAELASPQARVILLSVVRALLQDDTLAQRLREEAAAGALLSLDRFLRWPTYQPRSSDPHARPLPQSTGRSLTLGERKSLARRPDRRSFDRLLRDPHPDVIRMLLQNPRLTEDDVLRLAAKRPNFPDILVEIARTPRWSVRPRIRIALVLNPATPPEIAVPMVLLLVHHELRLVLELTDANAPVRAAAAELLRRRPPQLDEEPPDDKELLQ